MTEPFEIYSGVPDTHRDAPPVPNRPVLGAHRDETQYFPDPGLVNAVNVAFALGQPLLLAGPPGCGKTQLAYSVARELALGEVLKVSAASTTELGDLYYSFDHMTQYRDLQREDVKYGPERYVQVSGLGRALLQAGGPQQALQHMPGNIYDREEGLTRPTTAGDLMSSGFFEGQTGPAASIVLIDEIDKAPRDVPNDMLGWLETMSFEIAELGIRIAPFDATLNPDITPIRPLMFFTTNGEKRLPDPFLRRCAYYAIPFPDTLTLERILIGRQLPQGALTTDAIEVLMALHAPHAGLVRAPSVAEFIAWVSLLLHDFKADPGQPIRNADLRRSLPALIKLDDDLDAARRALADRMPGDEVRS